YISNISLNLGILVLPEDGKSDDEPRFARVKIPQNVPRLVEAGPANTYILLEDLISSHIGSLFPHRRVLEHHPFPITLAADSEIEEEQADDLLRTVEQQLRQPRFRFGVRLEVADRMSTMMVDMLARPLDLGPESVYSVEGMLNIPDLMMLHKLDLPA